MLKPTPAFLKALLTNEIAHALAGPFSGALDGLKVGLATNTLPEGQDLVFATDVDEPVYTTYAEQAVAWGLVYKRADGSYGVTGGLLTFQPTADPAASQVINAYFLVLPGGTPTVMAVENLATPVDLATAFDAFKIVPEIALDLADLGSATLVP